MSAAPDLKGVGMSEVPAPEVRRAAAQMTRGCLRRWDGLLGIRAYSDSLGNRAGIWRDRFDIVRCAVLLLGFKNLNQAVASQPSQFPRRLSRCAVYLGAVVLTGWTSTCLKMH